MRRLIWGFADCWKSHVTAQSYSFEASDAKSDINSCSDPVCWSEILAPDLVWQDLGDLLDPNYFQTLKAGERERERERETSACIRISCNLEKYHEWVLKSFSCASAFARQSWIFDGIDALHAFYRLN